LTRKSLTTLTQELVGAEPALRAVLDAHLADQGGEFLGHLFMADVTRWLVAHGPVPAVIAVLERSLVEGDEAVQDVIALSFLENLEPEDRTVRAALGPRLRAALDVQEDWPPDGNDPAA
jgi:hypothetical protein